MNDPRKEPNFIRRLFPSCDGQPLAPSKRTDRLGEVKFRFLVAYYRINFEYARLLALRRGPTARTKSATERCVLQSLEKAILAKEALEDCCASRGIVASPLYQEGFAINVSFQHSGARVARAVQIASSASRSLTFALPPGCRHRPRKA